MARIFAYVFAGMAAGFLFAAHGWLAWHYGFYEVRASELCWCAAPALLIALTANLVRMARVAAWLVACFAALLMAWSAWAARAAINPEDVGMIALVFTSWTQLFAIVAFLLPLLIVACFHHRVARPNQPLQRVAGWRLPP